jgi:nitrile hydratase beta subunit
MNGVHDMGGMHGFGPVCPERNEPVFHAPWEGRVAAIRRAMSAWGKWNIDVDRHMREVIPPAEYLRMSYYERWLDGLIEISIRTGLVTREEVRSGRAAPGQARAQPALGPAEARATLFQRLPFSRESSAAPRFAVGQAVRARNLHPEGHTRLPRYVRGRNGTIDRQHGVFVFPDTNAYFKGEDPQHLYSVRFAARELWGESAAGQDAVYLDLWESYLDPA